jgi:multidrug efflux pump subunit AcrA (membrane-fusion protein)
MSKRYAVLGLSAFLALALAVPAFGGPSNPIAGASASVKSIANKALKKAKAAQNTANGANATANAALSEAKTARDEAKKAQTTANGAQTTANTAKSTADAAKSTADAASAAAAQAEANANTRIKDSTQVVGESSGESNTASKFASAGCGSGQPVLGGGFSVGGENNKVTVTQSEEQLYGGGWFVAAQAIAGQAPTWSITAIAICGTK